MAACCKIPRLVFLQLALNVCIFITSMATSLSLGWIVIRYFDGPCILYSNMALTKANNNTLTMDVKKTTWGPKTTCDYCIYLPVVASILTFMWLWFFILGRKAGDRILEKETEKARRPEDWFLLIPGLIIGAVMFACCFAASIMITGGFRAWCTGVCRLKGLQCSDTAVLEWLNVENGKKVYPYLQTAMVSSWLLTIMTISFTVVAAYRCWLFIKGPPDNEEGGNDEEYDALASSTGIPNPNYEEIGAIGTDSARVSADEGSGTEGHKIHKSRKAKPV